MHELPRSFQNDRHQPRVYPRFIIMPLP